MSEALAGRRPAATWRWAWPASCAAPVDEPKSVAWCVNNWGLGLIQAEGDARAKFLSSSEAWGVEGSATQDDGGPADDSGEEED